MSASKRKVTITTTDEQIDAALARAKSYEELRPKAVRAAYRAKDDKISVDLASGVTIIIPRWEIQGLKDAEPGDVAKVQILDFGSVLHWPALDVDHYVPGLCEGVLGTAKWMAAIAGAKGGAARTPAKIEAARFNGRSGGRPRSADKVLAPERKKAATGLSKAAASRKNTAARAPKRKVAAAKAAASAKGGKSRKGGGRKASRRR